MVGWWGVGIGNLWVRSWLLGWVIWVHRDIGNEVDYGVDYGTWDEVADCSSSLETSRLPNIESSFFLGPFIMILA